jgi:hypothetical protein
MAAVDEIGLLALLVLEARSLRLFFTNVARHCCLLVAMKFCAANFVPQKKGPAEAGLRGPRPETVGYKDYVSAAMAQSLAEQAAPGRA